MARMLALVLLAAPASAQQFVRITTDVPPSTGSTEQIDFADVDLDGDWDAAFGNGGDAGNQQNVLWINRGGAQGGIVGVFANETSVRFPAILDATRDLEFADYDGDGDPDIAIANHSQLMIQASRFWTNRGLAQSGAIGTYVDETSTRWVGLGAPGSSVAQALVVAGGGFADFPQETDFADIDSDGDLDLVQSSVGGAFNGRIPTRIFRNDGAGYFSEFNPSGFQLTGIELAEGNPGLWCAGTQASNTLNSTGAFCDIAATAVDVDWADVDGDLDLDLLLCAEREPPRLFLNRLQENGGILEFHDVTGRSFQSGYATGIGHYEQCFGDFDDDDDMDIYGLSWLTSGSTFNDNVLRNSGAGYFDQSLTIPESAADEQSAEPIDYDLDGDLDVFVANFAGQERIVRNDGPWAFSHATGVLPADTTRTLDTDTADVDQDGDYDVFVANDSGQAEWYLRNTTAANDTTAPRIARLEQAPARIPGLDPTVVRCQVYDNAPPQTTQWLAPVLEVRVNSSPGGSFALRSSFGQVFRGEIPGGFSGVIEYRVVIADEHGNAGASPWLLYVSGLPATPFCFGDGSGTACPCGNSGAAGNGCSSSLNGNGANLAASGVPSVGADSLVLHGSGMSNSAALYLQGTAPAAAPFGDGLSCVGGTLVRLGTKGNVSGSSAYPLVGDPPISVSGACSAGDVRVYQCWYRNAANFCTPSTLNLTNGLRVLWL